MLYDTIEEYDTNIKLTQDAIARILLAGQTRIIERDANRRETAETTLPSLRRLLSQLQAEKAALKMGTTAGACYLGAGW